jgi:adenylate cyclase
VNRRARRLRTLLLLAAMVVIAAGTFALERTDALKRLEFTSVNERFAIRGQRPPPSKLAIVAIDTKTFQDLNVHWPFRRKYHARVIRNLTKAGAKVIAYDVQFTEAGRAGPKDDQALFDAVRASPKVVMATTEVGEFGDVKIFDNPENFAHSRATSGN